MKRIYGRVNGHCEKHFPCMYNGRKCAITVASCDFCDHNLTLNGLSMLVGSAICIVLGA